MLCLSVTVGHVFLYWRYVALKGGHKGTDQDKSKSLGFSATVSASKGFSCMDVRVHTISCSTPTMEKMTDQDPENRESQYSTNLSFH